MPSSFYVNIYENLLLIYESDNLKDRSSLLGSSIIEIQLLYIKAFLKKYTCFSYRIRIYYLLNLALRLFIVNSYFKLYRSIS